MRYELAKGISDCNMLVVDGDWKKQLEYGPSSFVARVCGKSIIHLDSLRLNNASPTPLVPGQLKVAHFLPLAGPELAPEQRNVAHVKERCTLKLHTFPDMEVLDLILDGGLTLDIHLYM